MVSDLDLIFHDCLSFTLGVALVVVVLADITVKHGTILREFYIKLGDSVSEVVASTLVLVLNTCKAAEASKDVQPASFTLTFIALEQLVE